MVLKSRSNKRQEKSYVNSKTTKDDDHDDGDDDDRKKAKSPAMLMQRLLRHDFKNRWWRIASWMFLNGIVYYYQWPQETSFSSTSMSCDALSSFSAWNRLTKGLVSSKPSPFQARKSYTTMHSSSTRRMVPALADRIEFYMGPHWFHPKLQGHPPSSPFTQQQQQSHWKNTLQSEHKQEQFYAKHDALVVLSMDPYELYQCLSGTEHLCTQNDDARMPQLAYDTMDAAFLVQEYYQNNILSHYYNVWKYEGILGCFTEFWLPMKDRSHIHPTYVWAKYPHDQTVATATYNTLTPVFGRIRDIEADNDREFFRHARPPLASDGADSVGPPVHATMLWQLLLHTDRSWLLHTLPNYDVPWEYKRDKKLYWSGHVTNVGQHHQLYLEYYRISKHLEMERIKEDTTTSTTASTISSIHSDSIVMQALRHKYLLVLEGEKSTAYDLLYKLYSNSVVFMPTPTYSSWLMETLLEPYVHYIPVNHTNLEQQFAWATSNPEQVQRIAERSTQWVHDLFLHPDAIRDDATIMRAMIHRYQQYILRAKPILEWNHIYDACTKHIHVWYMWFTDDWLRIAFVLVCFLYRYL